MTCKMIPRYALVLVLLTACAANTSVEAPPLVNLTGTWLLNESESSAPANLSTSWRDTRAELPAARDAADPPAVDRVLALVRSGTDRFTIVHGADSIAFQFGEDRTVALVPNWSILRALWAEGDTVDVRARWDNGRLRVERRLDAGITTTEYFSRGPGSSWLVVYTVVRGPAGAEATVRRVYDAAEDDEGST